MDRTESFLAYVIVTGKSNLTADEQARLQQLAGGWLKVGDKVQSAPTGVTPELPDFTGTVAELVNDQARVTLDAPISVAQGGATVTSTEVTVPLATLEKASA